MARVIEKTKPERSDGVTDNESNAGDEIGAMNSIIYLVGLVIVVLAILVSSAALFFPSV
jgi:hypothetical protein